MSTDVDPLLGKMDADFDVRPSADRSNSFPYNRRQVLSALASLGAFGSLAGNSRRATAFPFAPIDLRMREFLPFTEAADSRTNEPYFKAPRFPDTTVPAVGLSGWPLPKPTTSYSYPDEWLRRYVGAEVREILGALTESLSFAGYNDQYRRYFLCPGGFGLACAFENVNDYLQPKRFNRWDVDLDRPTNFWDLCTRTIDPYYYAHQRQFIFFLSSDRARGQHAPESFARLRYQYEQCTKRFDDRMNQFVISPEDRLCCYVYQYDVAKVGERRFVGPESAEVSAEAQLRRSGVITGVPP
jgi:hypothetical protein